MTTEKSISVAPSAATVVRLLEEAGIPTPSATNLIATAAVKAGLGDIAIDRLGFRLTLDGEPIEQPIFRHATQVQS